MAAEKPLGDQGELRNSNKYSDSKKARALTVIAMGEGNLTTAIGADGYKHPNVVAVVERQRQEELAHRISIL